jgi:4-hydroxy-2-oxoheptanedioate aldolase
MNKLKDKIQKKPVIGIWSIVSSAKLTEIFSLSGLDFIIFDKEHGHFSDDSLENAIRSCELGGAVPLVRVSSVNLQKTQTALDAGAYGVIAPKINTGQEARELVATALLPPYGERGFNPFTRAGNFSNKIDDSSFKLSKDFPMICAIVETSQGLSNLKEICSVDNLDVIYIGIYDLSVDLGFNGDVQNNELQEIVKNSIKDINDLGKIAGMMVSSADDYQKAIKLGAKFIVYSVDSYLIKNMAEEITQITS